MVAQKSCLFTYVLFLTGGLFAWHLLYLKRSRQAVLYCCTFGGYGLGLLYDLFNIPRYVSEANLDDDYVELHIEKRRHRSPEIAWERCVAEVVFGNILAYTVLTVMPEGLTKSNIVVYYSVLCILCPLMVAYAVWFVGGIGSQRLDFMQALFGSVLTIPLIIRSGPSGIFYAAVSSTIWANYRGNNLRAMEEINLEQKQSYCTHFLQFFIFVAIIYSCWGCAIYHNAVITTHDGVELPLSEFVANFLKYESRT